MKHAGDEAHTRDKVNSDSLADGGGSENLAEDVAVKPLAQKPQYARFKLRERIVGIGIHCRNHRAARYTRNHLKTIKQILAAHTEDGSCASCHASIDPYGYAFENFDPVGAWRDNYTEHIAARPSKQTLLEIEEQDRQRAGLGLPALPRPWESKPIPVDASAKLPDGIEYRDIIEFRRHLLRPENLERFVRCFITKLLIYANGAEPENEAEIQSILSQSAQNEHRIVDTIAAVADSALFRE